MIVSRTEAAQFHRDVGTALDLCTPEVWDQLREALALEATDYIRGLRLPGQLRENLVAATSGVDVLVMPTCKVVAPLRSEADDYLLVLSENCIPWSLVDFPAISLYMGPACSTPNPKSPNHHRQCSPLPPGCGPRRRHQPRLISWVHPAGRVHE